jgi:hypothetical protein
MITTILIVLLSLCVILLAREILKLKERLNTLHNETNNRISVTDQQIHLRINNDCKLLQSNIDEAETDLVNLINQRLDEEINDVKKLIPPTNDELLKEVQQMRDDFLALRQNF